jgi:hypothetical protein
MPNTPQQKVQVFAGIVTAWVLSGFFIVLGIRLFSGSSYAFQSPKAALAFSLATASIALLAGIGWASRTRHFVSNIDGSRPDAGSELDLTLRYVTNTTEQLLLFALACICIFQVDEATATSVLPVMAIWFLIARALFYFGYKITPVARSVGFAATFHPTIVLFAYVLMRVIA